jgi:hypothetical protein
MRLALGLMLLLTVAGCTTVCHTVPALPGCPTPTPVPAPTPSVMVWMDMLHDGGHR